ncbi:PA14 domain-containing protein [Streptomyces sp. V1I1]|uniref:PA14 domain-containing protein n=1 Tax=Streptomyces sp. V1I1 TaxID=3042272 RepID=UPI00277E3895|nr:PA14 domain-containing protein [Streptomyces sp. V1I1]MDQ0943159.1 RHS repeat-associated protein [Streptomyces sp. V1I1]
MSMKRSVRRYVAKSRAAFNFAKFGRTRRPLTEPAGPVASGLRRFVLVAMTTLVLLSDGGTALAFSFDAFNSKPNLKPLAVDAATPSDSPASTGVTKKDHDTSVGGGLSADAETRPGPGAKQAHKERTPVKELKNEYTPHDKVTLNSDGTKTVKHSVGVTNFRSSDGAWHDVDTTLRQTNLFPATWQTTSNSWTTTFAPAGLGSGITISDNGSSVTFGPKTKKLVDPVVTTEGSMQLVTYHEVWPGVDLEFLVTSTDLKETIIIKRPGTATSFDFNVDGATLAAIADKPGWFQVKDALQGQFIIPAPTVATATGGVIGDAPYATQSVQGSTLSATLSESWLAEQPKSVYPLRVDPSFTGSTGNNYVSYKSDGYVCSPGQGCGNSVGTVTGPLNHWRFVTSMSFPSSTFSGKYIQSAYLHVEMPSCGNSYGICDPTNTYVNKAACWGYNCVDTAYGEGYLWTGTWGNVDVTTLYRNLQAAGQWDAPLIVRGMEATWTTYKLFAHDRTFTTITYDTQPPMATPASDAPGDGSAVVTTQPMLSVNPVSDAEGEQVYYYYRVSPNPDAEKGPVANSGWVTTPNWTIPDNILEDGTTYYWHVYTWDGYTNVPNTAPNWVRSFRVDMRNGKNATQVSDDFGGVSTDLATGNLATSATTHGSAALGGSLGVGLSYNSPLRARSGLTAQYWNDTAHNGTFSGNPLVTRVEPNINTYWGNGASSSPDPAITADYFLGRWTGYFVAPQTGNYQFNCSADDGQRLWVNNTQLHDQWTSCNTPWSGNIALTAGQVVPIKVEFREIGGGAGIWLRVKTPDSVDQVVPNAWLRTDPQHITNNHGLVGRYFADSGSHTFPADNNAFMVRNDPLVSFDWGSGGATSGAPTDSFMVRWTGYFMPPTSGNYTFGSTADDGTRITVNNTQVLSNWSDSPGTNYGSAIGLTAGVAVPVTFEYYENGGAATANLLVKTPDNSTGQVVPSNWLLTKSSVVPDGWNLSTSATGNLSYDRLKVNQNSVVLTDSTGMTHEYTALGGGAYKPPVNEAGVLTRNSDGTLTLQDSDGRTYVFNTDGTLQLATTAPDDRQPAALQYTYSGTPSRLSQITDGVSSSRWMKLYYSGDSNCPSVPSGFTAYSSTAGMMCAAATNDGNVTQLLYVVDGSGNPRLSRIVRPGSELTDYGYDASGRLTQVRTSVANDAVLASIRSQDGTEVTQIAYDVLGRVSGVTLPAATGGATRQAHSYDYQVGHTKMNVANATEPNGFSRKVAYDATYRTTTDTDIANLTATTEWDASKDLVLSTTDTTGLKSTTIYDYADRATDQYGPAPASFYGTNRIPTSYYPLVVPHVKTGYDEGINGLAAAYFDVATSANGTGTTSKLLFGAPKSHQTGVGTSNGDVVKTWGTSQPITPSQSTYGWGVSLTGSIKLPETGSHTFKVKSDDGARLWVDDTLVVDDWNDGSYEDHAAIQTFNNATANSWHRVRLDYYNKAVGSTLDTDAHLELFKTAPGGSETSALGSLLTPRYGLTTSRTVYDSSSSVGTVTTSTNYGANPELSLASATTLDPAGLSYTGNSNYEVQGATGSFLRQTNKVLPGGTTTSYTYYGATDIRDNPCTTGTTEAFKQAGMLKLKTEADPDGAGSQTSRLTETIYDDAGRTVATRYNSDAWTCTTYDSRGRITQVAVPSLGAGKPARTITNNYAVSGNPLVISASDSEGTISTTADLLGRTVSYTDAEGNTTTTTYDTLGRLSSRTSPLGLEEFTYDSYGRLSAQKLDSTTYAVPSYDAYSRMSGVTYPTAGSLALAISRDSFGRVAGKDYTLGNGTTHITDSVTRSQSGQIISGTELGASKSYAYDKAGRLTSATVGANSWSYGFGTPTACTGTYNVNAGKNSNRTSQTATVGGATTTTTYCYDNADRLVSSSDALVNGAVYDAHGNTTTIGTGTTPLQLIYDSSDRNTGLEQYDANGSGFAEYYSRDVQGRLVWRGRDNITNWDWVSQQYYAFGYTGSGDAPSFVKNDSGSTIEKILQLPGGVTFNIRSNYTVSLPNLHGDVMATTNASGAQTGTFQYDPFGKVLSSMPSNATGTTYGWEGQNQKLTESDFALAPTQMGARVYLSSIGRFLQVDPTDGGVQNAYVYPPNPLRSQDLDGNSSTAEEVFANMGENASSMGLWLDGGLVGLGIFACVVGAIACAAGAALGIAVASSIAYSSTRDWAWAGFAGATAYGSGLFGGYIGKKMTEHLIGAIAPSIASKAGQGASQSAKSKRVVAAKQRINAVAGGVNSYAIGKLPPSPPSRRPPSILSGNKGSAYNNMVLIISGRYF